MRSNVRQRGAKATVQKRAVTAREGQSHRSPGTPLAPEIVAFCAREQIAQELLDEAILLAKKHFAISVDPVVRLEQDLELDEAYLVVEVSTSGQVPDIVAAHLHFAREWAAAVPWPKSGKIRLTYDID